MKTIEKINTIRRDGWRRWDRLSDRECRRLGVRRGSVVNPDDPSLVVYSPVGDVMQKTGIRAERLARRISRKHEHFCDICEKPITTEDFLTGRTFELNNAPCSGDYCDFRHRSCQDSLVDWDTIQTSCGDHGDYINNERTSGKSHRSVGGPAGALSKSLCLEECLGPPHSVNRHPPVRWVVYHRTGLYCGVGAG